MSKRRPTDNIFSSSGSSKRARGQVSDESQPSEGGGDSNQESGNIAEVSPQPLLSPSDSDSSTESHTVFSFAHLSGCRLRWRRSSDIDGESNPGSPAVSAQLPGRLRSSGDGESNPGSPAIISSAQLSGRLRSFGDGESNPGSPAINIAQLNIQSLLQSSDGDDEPNQGRAAIINIVEPFNEPQLSDSDRLNPPSLDASSMEIVCEDARSSPTRILPPSSGRPSADSSSNPSESGSTTDPSGSASSSDSSGNSDTSSGPPKSSEGKRLSPIDEETSNCSLPLVEKSKEESVARLDAMSMDADEEELRPPDENAPVSVLPTQQSSTCLKPTTKRQRKRSFEGVGGELELGESSKTSRLDEPDEHSARSKHRGEKRASGSDSDDEDSE